MDQRNRRPTFESIPPGSRILVLFLALLGYLTLFQSLGGLPYLGADEPRYARIGEEMAADGDWVTPHFLGQPWLEKPPLLFWMEAASFSVFEPSEGAARLPNAILGLLTALLLGYMLSRAAGPQAGVLGYAVLLTTPLFLVFCRAASTDLPLAATVTAALLLGWRSEEERSPRWAAAAGIMLGLAFLAKGPVALILVGVPFYLHALWKGDSGWNRQRLTVALTCALLVAGPWYVLVTLANGQNFLVTFWLNHHVARFITDLHHHSQPFWFYLPVLLVGTYPWTFSADALVTGGKSRYATLDSPRDRLESLLMCHVVFTVVFFSVSQSKLPGYILPAVPALAGLFALEWDRLLNADVRIYRSMKRSLKVTAGFGLLLFIATAYGFDSQYGDLKTGVLVAVPLLLAVLPALGRSLFRLPAQWFLVFVVAVVTCMSLLYRLGSPLIGSHHSAKAVCEIVRPHLSGREPMIFYRFYHHTARYYTDFRTTWDSVNSPEELIRYMASYPQNGYWLLTHAAGARELENRFGALLVSRSGPFHLVHLHLARGAGPEEAERGVLGVVGSPMFLSRGSMPPRPNLLGGGPFR